MDKKTILNLSKKYSSFYLYDESQILSNISQLYHAFPNIKLLYSIKSNSNQEVLKTIFNNNLGADTASINEVFMAQKLGLSRNNIFYSAPGKSPEEGLKNSTLIAGSINELRKINEIGKCNHTIYKIGVRINPNFSFKDELGYPSKFGIDEDKLFQLFNKNTLNNIKIIGIHIHLKSQELSTKKLINYYQNVILLALQVQKRLRSPLTFINMGSGIGVPYRSTDNPVNITLLGKRLSSLLSRFHSQLVNTKIIIESGRHLTCNAGTYVTRVLDRKISHEQTFLILSNTLNGFIRPSLAMLINITTIVFQ